MPDRTISSLGALVAVLVLAYLGLVVTTVSFAAWQTDLAVSAQDTESSIGSLEGQYYAQVGRLAATDPASLGLSKPSHVSYAVAATAPTLTLR